MSKESHHRQSSHGNWPDFFQFLLVLFIIVFLIGLSPAAAVHASDSSIGLEEQSVGIVIPIAPMASVSLEAAADTCLRKGNQTRNYGGSPTVQVVENTFNRQHALFLWDLGAISSNSTVVSASITFFVTLTSDFDFNLYQMRRAWVEGTSNGAISTTSANWDTFNGTTAWGSGGAMSTTTDRYDVDLWDATASTFRLTNSVTVPLNSAGIAAVQSWISTPSTNYGMTLQFMGTSSGGDDWVVASRENTTYAGPTLNITYSEPVPTITSAGLLTEFGTPLGTPSAAQTYTVAGSDLTADVSITAPAGFEISLDGNHYSFALTLSHSGGTITATTIHVRLTGASTGTFSGNIIHTSVGAASINVAVTGTTIQYYLLTTSAGTGGSIASAAGSYPSGAVVTLTATADAGYFFAGWTGDLTGFSNPASITMDRDKNITATFAVGTCSNTSLIATEDTFIRNDTRSSFNYGGSQWIRVNPFLQSGTTDGQLTAILIRWNTLGDGSNSSNVIITRASIVFHVSDGSNNIYGLYAMRRSWLEGTNNGTAGSGASWNFYGAGTGNWGIAGAQNTSTDRYDTNLWDATAEDFSALGSHEFTLNDYGLAAIQDWVIGSLSNFGLTIQNYSGTATDVWEAASRESTMSANRPRLNLTYCVVGDPAGVDINYFRAARTAAGVQLSWETVNEATLAGFNLYRRELDGKFEKLNSLLIPPEKGGQPEGYTYIYQDETAALDQRYEYRLEVIETNLEPSASILAPYWPHSLQLPMIRQ